MAKKINTTLLGIFVLGAVVLALSAIALFGSGKLFKHLTRYVIYFPETVQGLTIGAPVRFRGINLGTVVDMRAMYVKNENKIIIPVYVEIDRSRVLNLAAAPADPQEQQEMLIKAGLRAQLITDSIVTGQRAVALDIRPEEPIRLIGADSSVAEIASIPSSLEQLSQKLESLPIDDIAGKIDRTMTAIEAAVTSPQFTEGLDNLGPTVVEARKVMTALSADLQPLLTDVRTKLDAFDARKLSEKLDSSLTAIDAAAQNIAALGRQGAPLDNNVNRALIEIAAAARELRQLAELLQRRPEVLLAGKK